MNQFSREGFNKANLLLLIHTIWTIIKIIRISQEEEFAETTTGAPLHSLSKLHVYDVAVDFASPTPHLRQCFAEGWLLLDIECFVFFSVNK